MKGNEKDQKKGEEEIKKKKEQKRSQSHEIWFTNHCICHLRHLLPRKWLLLSFLLVLSLLYSQSL